MKILDKWFGKSKSTDTQNDSANQLIISVNKNGKIFIDFKINHFGMDAAENFGKMLFYMNEGLYVQTILDLLSHISKTKSSNHIYFVDDTIKAWSDLVAAEENLDKSNTDSKPIVSPSNFYKITGYQK